KQPGRTWTTDDIGATVDVAAFASRGIEADKRAGVEREVFQRHRLAAAYAHSPAVALQQRDQVAFLKADIRQVRTVEPAHDDAVRPLPDAPVPESIDSEAHHARLHFARRRVEDHSTQPPYRPPSIGEPRRHALETLVQPHVDRA